MMVLFKILSMPVFLRGSISEIYLQLPYALQHQTKWRGTSPSLLSSNEEQINSMDSRCCRLSFLYFLGQTSALLNLVRRRRRIWRVNESVCIVEKHLPCWLVAFIHSVRTRNSLSSSPVHIFWCFPYLLLLLLPIYLSAPEVYPECRSWVWDGFRFDGTAA